jgi:hypothetical protein
MSLPCLRQFFACLSPWRLRLSPRPVRVGCVVDKVALGQVFLQIVRVFPYQYQSAHAQ